MVHKNIPHMKYSCPACGSKHVDLVDDMKTLICLDCGFEGTA